MAEASRTCNHCGTGMSRWKVPDDATWSAEFFYVCFNDDCSYYKRGWVWMMEQFSQKASYRFAVNPRTGGETMIPVWSDAATREMIVDEDEGGE